MSVLSVFVLCAGSIVYFKTNNRGVSKAENNNNVEEAFNAYVDVYSEQNSFANAEEKEEPAEENSNSDVNSNTASSSPNDEKVFTFTALGEIMMGGMDTSYVLPFKDVAELASSSDYTFTSLTTNVVDLEKIEDPKSKYIVTKDILKAFTALGIDGVNVASDHMLDFGTNIFKGTKEILSDAKLDVIGVQDDVIYAENNGIKVAFIGVSNEIIGSYSDFIDAGVWVYDDYMVKIKEAIKKAQDTADTVVVITHLGSENKHVKTDVMTWFYHELVNAGADLVLGNHALGVYPIEIYNDTPIIYSLGYFMHDTDYEVGKKSGIFTFTVDVDGKIASMEFTPTYITNNEVKIYAEYDYESALEFMEYVENESNVENDLYDVQISQKSMIVTFNK